MGRSACAGALPLAPSQVHYLFRNVASPFYLHDWIDSRRFNWHGVPRATIIFWGPEGLFVILSAVLGVRHYLSRKPLTHMLVWGLPLSVATALYWSWLFESPVVEAVGEALVLAVAICIWVVGLDRAIAARRNRNTAADAHSAAHDPQDTLD